MRRNTNQQPYTTQQRELPPTEYESIGYEQGSVVGVYFIDINDSVI